MELYRRLARPALFALPPEGAHRVAQALLRLPLPWRRIGGVEPDPLLETDLAGMRLPNPVGLAAGFDKSCRLVTPLGELGFGYLVCGTVTRQPRRGNRKPRIVRHPDELSIVNSMGLPNRGAAFAASRLRGARRTAPVVVSLADEAIEDVLAGHALLQPLAEAIELNVSCPNVSWGRDRDNEEHLRELLRAIAPSKRKPLFVKLPPYRAPAERDAVMAVLAIAQEGGADGLTCSNTVPVEERTLASGSGGLSGRAVFADTVRIVEEVRSETGGAVPINATGGIFGPDDAIACLDAGATTVQVYTGMIYRGPHIVRDITAGLASAIRARSVAGRGVGSGSPVPHTPTA
ncbi:MAG: dihydroorotate dehydrogenase (quinone) [Actinomycetota bacterium]